MSFSKQLRYGVFKIMTQPILKVINLVKKFTGEKETIHAVNNVSFEIFPGETLGLVGESGSGKSTIGRCIMKLQNPTSGKIIFNNENLNQINSNKMRLLRKDIQIVFQDPYSALNPRMKVGNLIGELLKIHSNLNSNDRRDKVLELASKVHLNSELLNRFPNELSGGQLQRICVARALATNPKLIVLDEPTSSLDLSVRAGILKLLSELQEEYGIAMLFISHDLETIELISKKVIVLYLGSIVESGYTSTIFNKPAHPYTKALLSADLPPDPLVKLNRQVLKGEVPSPVNLPEGCLFAPRCPVFENKCSEKLPKYINLSEYHNAACIKLKNLN